MTGPESSNAVDGQDLLGEIERLRAENARLRMALESIELLPYWRAVAMQEIARQALGEEE